MAVAAVCCLVSRDELRFGEAVLAVQGRLLDVDVLAVTSAVAQGSLAYAAIGLQVGMAQRMESVAPAGAVMLSESTAPLVEHIMMLAVPHDQGSDSVEADSFTAGDAIEVFEPRTACWTRVMLLMRVGSNPPARRTSPWAHWRPLYLCLGETVATASGVTLRDRNRRLHGVR